MIATLTVVRPSLLASYTSARQTGKHALLKRLTSTSASASRTVEISENDILANYKAPLAKTFYRLKLFSLSSLCAAVGLTPALLFAPAEVGLAGRVGLCATALATSGASTAIFAWIGKPYVGGMRLISAEAANDIHDKDAHDTTLSLTDSMHGVKQRNGGPAIEALTTDWRLRKLSTVIYEPSLIRPTSRPLATWELALNPPAIAHEESQEFPVAKLIAATRLVKTGQLIGRQWTAWPQSNVQGKSTVQGNLIRHYTIHEELLDEDWKIL